MKTKAQKQEELNTGKALLKESVAVLFIDFSNVRTADLRRLRSEFKKAGSRLLVMKKRLLGLLFREKGIEVPMSEAVMKTQVGAVFAKNFEEAAGSAYRFFKELEKEKKIKGMKILGGVDMARSAVLDMQMVTAVGSLPPREALLAQLAAMIAAPVRSLLYLLDQRAKRSE